MDKMFVWPILAGFLFSTWPFVMRATGLPPVLAAVFLTTASLFVYPFFLRGDMNLKALTLFVVILAVVAGLMNGFGTIAFQKMIANKEMNLAIGIFVLIMTQIVVTTIGGLILDSEDILTTKKLLGIGAAACAVYLLTGK